jgi:hypothetical protein
VQESPGEVTILLNDLKLGNKEALSKLIPLVYAELLASCCPSTPQTTGCRPVLP